MPLLVSGRLGDRYGPKRVLLAGLLIFVAASLGCGLAYSPSTLIAARAVQGLGAAAIAPHTLTLVTRLFPPGRRGTPMGASGAVGGFGAASGFFLGGVVVDQFGWPWIFLLNVPIGVIVIVLAQRLIPDWQPSRSHRFDILGITLFCSGLALFVVAIQEGERFRWGTVIGPITIPMLILGGLMLLATFVVWQRVNHREPLLGLRLFGHRNLSMVSLAHIASQFAVTGFWLPFMVYLQSIRGLSPTLAGVLTTPVPLIGAALGPLAGWLSDRVPGRWVTFTGFLALITGIGIIAVIAQPTTQPAALIPALLAIAVGTGFLFPPLNNIATHDLGPTEIGASAGILRTAQQLGGVIGTAAIGAVIQIRLAVELPIHAREQAATLPASYRPNFVASMSNAANAGSDFDAATTQAVLSGIPEPAADQLRIAAENAFTAAFTNVTKTALVLVIVALLLGAMTCPPMTQPRS